MHRLCVSLAGGSAQRTDVGEQTRNVTTPRIQYTGGFGVGMAGAWSSVQCVKWELPSGDLRLMSASQMEHDGLQERRAYLLKCRFGSDRMSILLPRLNEHHGCLPCSAGKGVITSSRKFMLCLYQVGRVRASPRCLPRIQGRDTPLFQCHSLVHIGDCLSFQALIDEDRLLSRLEVLENQLQTYSKVW